VTPRVIGFYLVPDFPMIALASAMEPLRIANRLSGRRLYDWRLISRSGAPERASNGLVLTADAGIADTPSCDVVFACAGLFAQEFRDRAVFAWLRRLHRCGCRLGGISTGTYLLARSGILDGRRCTIHWENVASLAEEFPLLHVTDDIFVEDGTLLTCSGGTGTIDMMLHVVAREHGRALATLISDQIMHPRIRGQHDHQRTALEARLAIAHPKLAEVVREMQCTVEEPLAIERLARGAGLSPRHLERLSSRVLGKTPRDLYRELRLQRGQALLQQTGLSVLEIALACGFVSATHFSRCYRYWCGHSPSEERRTLTRLSAPTTTVAH
jgi:transcriptional regulator GlxA family with amidase domain